MKKIIVLKKKITFFNKFFLQKNFYPILKKVLSIKFIALVISIIAAYYTYKAYTDSKPGELVILHLDNVDDGVFVARNASKTTRYWNLLITDVPFIQTNFYRIKILDSYLPVGSYLCLPIIRNVTSKSLEHFKCKINIWFDRKLHDAFENSFAGRQSNYNIFGKPDYKIVDFNDCSLDLEYEDDFLPAEATLPEPFKELLIPEELKDKGAKISLNYYITFDGVNKPYYFSVDLTIFITDYYNNEEYVRKVTNNFFENEVYSKYNQRNARDNEEWSLSINNFFIQDIVHTKPANVTDWDIKSIQQLVKPKSWIIKFFEWLGI